MRTPKIAVVGGGIGGLAAAAILSRDFAVHIFEALAARSVRLTLAVD